jgi:hypothetical protein
MIIFMIEKKIVIESIIEYIIIEKLLLIPSQLN